MKLIPDPAVARRYGITLRTLYRWEKNPTLGFPPAARINGRKYRRVDDLAAWDRACVNPKVTEEMQADSPAGISDKQASSHTEAV
jgi:predicted DNA-binding transcriptional regulator AlpA